MLILIFLLPFTTSGLDNPILSTTVSMFYVWSMPAATGEQAASLTEASNEAQQPSAESVLNLLFSFC